MGINKVCDHLFVCSQREYDSLDPLWISNNCSLCFCAKDPYHKKIVGYIGKVDKLHPEYLYAERNRILALNMIDVNDPKYFSDDMINKALNFIEKEIKNGRDVILVCNKGESRSPSIAMMYMLKKGFFKGYKSFEMIEEAFKEIYPKYNPKTGIKVYIKEFINKRLCK